MKGLLGVGWRRYRSWPVWAQVVVGVLAVAVAVSPFTSSDKGKTVQAGQAAGRGTSGDRVTTTTASVTTTSAPATTSTTAPATTRTTGAGVAESALPGFGSTRAQWDATHEMAPGFMKGSAYLPFITGKQPTYAGVIDYGRVVSYDVYMVPGTTLVDARARVLKELPTDAKPGKLVAGDGCHLQEFRSATLERVLDGKTVIVAYSDDDPTIPANRRYRVATLVVTTPGEENFC